MDTRLAATNIRMQQWMTDFKEKTESGLTVDEYCDQKGISRNAYYYWLRKVRSAALEHTTFVELKVPETEPDTQISTSVFVPQLTIVKNDAAIGINSTTPKELLALALEAVSHV